MTDHITRFKFFFIALFFCRTIFAQLSAGSCVHSKGIGYYLDAYLASLGACDCQRTGVFLTGFSKCNNDPYVTEFEDNFDGDTIDLVKWQLSPSAQSNLEGGQSVELRTLNNVRVKDGICSIIARKETVISRAVNYKPDNELLADGNPNLRTYNYTSSLLVTRADFFHGKYEIRCRMPKGNGFWPAFWMFGGKRYNEVDVFDAYKGTDKMVSALGHDYDGDGKPSGCSETYRGVDLSEWHTYACIWEADRIAFLVDDRPLGIIYRVLSPSKKPVVCGDELGNGTYFQLMSYPLEPMKIIFNMALISKNGPGGSVPVDESTPFPSSFDVDYIRFSKRTPGAVDVYPNPAEDSIRVESKTTILSVSLSNLTGQQLYTAGVDALSAGINLSLLPAGVYVLTVGLEGVTKRVKVLKITP